jgi:hypothetical protein
MKKERIEKLFHVYEKYLDGRKLTLDEKEIFIDAYLLGFNEAKIKYNNYWNIDENS